MTIDSLYTILRGLGWSSQAIAQTLRMIALLENRK